MWMHRRRSVLLPLHPTSMLFLVEQQRLLRQHLLPPQRSPITLMLFLLELEMRPQDLEPLATLIPWEEPLPPWLLLPLLWSHLHQLSHLTLTLFRQV